MISAYLHLEYEDEDGEVVSTKRTKSIDFVLLPRIGERMCLDGETWGTVTDILHGAEMEGWPADDHPGVVGYPLPYIILIVHVPPKLKPLWPLE